LLQEGAAILVTGRTEADLKAARETLDGAAIVSSDLGP
jgi:hypothetical protein